jgi:hypothetical protein
MHALRRPTTWVVVVVAVVTGAVVGSMLGLRSQPSQAEQASVDLPITGRPHGTRLAPVEQPTGEPAQRKGGRDDDHASRDADADGDDSDDNDDSRVDGEEDDDDD